MNPLGGDSPYVIAEIGSNHNGDFGKAKEMVAAAAEAGVEAVKFQVYTPEKLCHPSQAPAPILRGRYKNQRERFRSMVLADSEYVELRSLAEELGVNFVASVFDVDNAQMLAPLVSAFKVASGDIDNLLLIEFVAATDKPVVVSTGMADLADVDRISSLIDHDRLALLHCVSLYPTPTKRLNLDAIRFLKARYPDAAVGYSDHHPGIRACLYAAVLGAEVIEKHFTLDKNLDYGDHAFSADYDDMRKMVDEIKDITSALGRGGFEKSEEELEKRTFFRRGVYAARDLEAGESLRAGDIVLLRPPNEIGADEVGRVIGRTLKRGFVKEEPVSREDLV